MLAILFDRKINDICCYWGTESVLEMSVLNGTLKEHFFCELESAGINNAIILNDDNISSEFKEIQVDKCFLFFTNSYFEFSQTELIQRIAENKNDVILVDKNDNFVGLYCLKDTIERILSKDISFDELNFEKYTVVDYFFEINNYSDYKKLIEDILDKKCYRSLPTVAEGVYAVTSIPKGDFVIVPPVFLDENIQIEDGCVIGPYSVIMNGTLVAKNSCIKKSFLDENSFVSSNCFVEDSVCCKNSSICRNSAVFSGCVIVHNTIINEDTFLENNSLIKPFMRINSNDNSSAENMEISNNSQAFFYGLNPEKSALLGGALGNVFEKSKVAVLSDGEKNSTALKLSLIGGLMTTGAECFDFGSSFFSSIYYYLEYCQLDCGVYVSGKKNGTAIYIVEKNKEFLSRGKRILINSIMKDGNISRCDEKECKNIRQIHGMQRMYIQHLIKAFTDELNVFPVYNCNNNRLKSVMEIATSKIGISSYKKRMEFTLNDEGNMLSIKADEKTYSHKEIVQTVSYFLNRKSPGNYSELWRYDAVCLSFTLLKILAENNIDIHTATDKTPSFYLAQKEIEINEPFSKIVSYFKDAEDIVYRNNEMVFKSKNSRVNMTKNRGDNRMKIGVNGVSMEAAKEILGDILKIIGDYSDL